MKKPRRWRRIMRPMAPLYLLHFCSVAGPISSTIDDMTHDFYTLKQRKPLKRGRRNPRRKVLAYATAKAAHHYSRRLTAKRKAATSPTIDTNVYVRCLVLDTWQQKR
jgi:hypothetical protein